jgi:hypothetical protein
MFHIPVADRLNKRRPCVQKTSGRSGTLFCHCVLILVRRRESSQGPSQGPALVGATMGGHSFRLQLLASQLAPTPLPPPTAADTAVGPAAAAAGRRTHEPGAVPPPRAPQEWVDRIACLHELVPLAKQLTRKEDWEFMRGGTDTETSVRRNRLAIDSLALCPSMATDVSQCERQAASPPSRPSLFPGILKCVA